jgi:phosphatidylserine decarboxylase
MTIRSSLLRFLQQEDLNFLLTNRIPRHALTHFMAWFSKIEQPLVRDASIAVWRMFCDVDLNDAKKSRFVSLHDCFVRELKAGARPIDPAPEVLVSPCDAIVGAFGDICGTELFQAKEAPYALEDLLGDPILIDFYRNGHYVTLRITAGMYHRFHAPHDCTIEQVRYLSGDVWNVNPVALRRVQRLFCKNERAIIRARLAANGDLLTMVPVAAVLVASIRLHFADVLFHLKYPGPETIPCDAKVAKGQELGWFQHGSTIILFLPKGYRFCHDVDTGRPIRVGQPLMCRLTAEAVTMESGALSFGATTGSD